MRPDAVFCLACRQNSDISTFGGQIMSGSIGYYGVCQICRRHAEIGRLVEAMPEGAKIRRLGPHTVPRDPTTTRWHLFVGMGLFADGDDLLELLRSAKELDE